MSGSANAGRRMTVEDVLKNPKWPSQWPYSAQDFARADESDDEMFYDSPRLVYHIDDKAGQVNTCRHFRNFKFTESEPSFCVQLPR